MQPVRNIAYGCIIDIRACFCETMPSACDWNRLLRQYISNKSGEPRDEETESDRRHLSAATATAACCGFRYVCVLVSYALEIPACSHQEGARIRLAGLLPLLLLSLCRHAISKSVSQHFSACHNNRSAALRTERPYLSTPIHTPSTHVQQHHRPSGNSRAWIRLASRASIGSIGAPKLPPEPTTLIVTCHKRHSYTMKNRRADTRAVNVHHASGLGSGSRKAIR